ncbi:bifunctional 5,10-methylenetetrahydrofolate dehydrogenase/5,10-methenyltetrahydrofolate cyclohydrolase [Mycoplasmopsis opalescens]|uniref:bifunctional 5,10-methylenetetrahydrofolate dehydrogenase/5,10-methenyltetrahydrofolate cyclohydrolase n=1 Tax=Mycoplasmopsis opalescens TaxID=114886 RepID=UPI0004A72F00|nr:bifunctional 5,10-methylenetetrahydrofolate dehydrogenase/5,10-methenyltetrahydrofolate cyclohydrolase [Mycoplasmopsis opalescens]
MLILNGNVVAEKITAELKKEFAFLTKELRRKPNFAILQVGDNPASNKYIQYKMAKATDLGINVTLHKYPETVSQKFLLKKLDIINEEADGIIVQLPLPETIAKQVILDAVRHDKDIDGLSTRNAFNFYNDTEEFQFTPATAQAIMYLFEHYNIDLKDKKVGVVGPSHLVGKPVTHLIKRHTDLVSTYNKNSGIRGIENADVVVVATGVMHLISKSDLKEGAVAIDVGSTWIEKDGKKVSRGDINPEGLEKHLSAFAPVPGGVGPLTVVALMQNLAKAIRHNNKI